MKLEVALLAGAETKEFLLELTKQIDRLEALSSQPKLDKAPAAEEVEDEDDEDFAPKKKADKKKPFEDDDDDSDSDPDSDDDTIKPGKDVDEDTLDADEDEDSDDSDDGDEDEEDEKPKKRGRKKKITSDDCNDAAKKLAKAIGGKPGREAVLKIMKKQFGTQSVSELKPNQYADFVCAMEEALEEVGA